jgi:hypothetical protein
MKKTIILFSIIILSISCSDKKEIFELYSPEAFAFSVDEGWELNASCRVKGFVQKEIDNQYSAKLSYSVDLVNTEGKVIQNVDEGFVDKKVDEKISDLPINVQIQIDSSYPPGLYQIIIYVRDDFGNLSSSIQRPFELEIE